MQVLGIKSIRSKTEAYSECLLKPKQRAKRGQCRAAVIIPIMLLLSRHHHCFSLPSQKTNLLLIWRVFCAVFICNWWVFFYQFVHTLVHLYVCQWNTYVCMLCVCVYWAPGRLLTNIISSLIWVSEQKQEGFKRAQWFPAAACCREKTVSCFPLVDPVAVGHLVVVNNTKGGNVSDSCVMIEKRKADFFLHQAMCVSFDVMWASWELQAMGMKILTFSKQRAEIEMFQLIKLVRKSWHEYYYTREKLGKKAE